MASFSEPRPWGKLLAEVDEMLEPERPPEPPCQALILPSTPFSLHFFAIFENYRSDESTVRGSPGGTLRALSSTVAQVEGELALQHEVYCYNLQILCSEMY